jgi:hypothetical protein
MPHSALTRFLKQGLARGMCPLCRVAHKLEGEYVWYFFDEYSGQGWALDEVRRSWGFCRVHADMLRRVEVDGLRSTLGISKVYLDTLGGLGAVLDELDLNHAPEHGQCPGCAYRDEGVHQNARYLLDELSESERFLELFKKSPGLCMPHFELVWSVTGSNDERRLILEVQRRVVAEVAEDLREHIDKHDHRRKGEPKGKEYDSWLRAIRLTAGWNRDEASEAASSVADEAPPLRHG